MSSKVTITITFTRSGPKLVWGFFKAWMCGVGVVIVSDPTLVEVVETADTAV